MRAISAFSLVFLSLLPASPAWGEEPSEIDRDAARTAVQQGDERMEEGDLQAAVEAYRRADEIMGVPTTAIEVGRVEMQLGHLVAARDAFQRAAEHPFEKGEPEPFTRAREEAAVLLAEVAARVPSIRLRLRGLEEGVTPELRIDGKTITSWDTSIEIDPGSHVIEVIAEGYQTLSSTFELAEGSHDELPLRIEPIEVELAGPVTDEGPPSWAWPTAIGGGALAGAGLIVGAVTGGLSLGDAATAKESCDPTGRCNADAEGPLDRSRTLAHVSTTSFVLAGVGAAVGAFGLVVALEVFDDDQEEAASALTVGPTSVSWRVRF